MLFKVFTYFPYRMNMMKHFVLIIHVHHSKNIPLRTLTFLSVKFYLANYVFRHQY